MWSAQCIRMSYVCMAGGLHINFGHKQTRKPIIIFQNCAHTCSLISDLFSPRSEAFPFVHKPTSVLLLLLPAACCLLPPLCVCVHACGVCVCVFNARGFPCLCVCMLCARCAVCTRSYKSNGFIYIVALKSIIFHQNYASKTLIKSVLL